MIPFGYVRLREPSAAAAVVGRDPSTGFLAGGTSLIDLMKDGVEGPALLVDVRRLAGLDRIEETSTGGVLIGAMATNATVAANARVRRDYPVLSQAIEAGASAQLREMATVGGNLLQRTRCGYLRDPGFPACNKRDPGTGCGAIGGESRGLAVLGVSDACIATHASDMCVALAALDAVVHVLAPDQGERRIPFHSFHRLPGDTPHIETVLNRGDLITGVELPRPEAPPARQHYLKVRDRTSYAFALASVAVALTLDEDGTIRTARLALGGVGTVPWRAGLAERVLIGAPNRLESYREAAEAELSRAKPQDDNQFKVDLAKRAIMRALRIAGGA